MSLNKLVFDTTDVDTIADSHSVGAYLRSSDGTLLTHTDVGGKQALDVRIAEGINVEVDLDAADDSVAAYLSDGAGTALTSTLVGAKQSLDVNVVESFDAALANDAILASADTLAVAGTAEKVVAANLAERKYLSVYNNDNRVIYIGGAGVDAATGFPVSPGSYMELRAGAAVDVYYNSDKTSHAIRTLELS